MAAGFNHLATALILSVGLALAALPGAAETVDYGKPGDPIKLTIGYQPYYTEAWSGVIMRGKKFYEKYLPKDSQVEFQIGLQGAVIVNGMLTGKVDLGYVGDMPALIATSQPDVRDLRIVATLGLGSDQCNSVLVRPDAPAFESTAEAIRWLDGKTVAVPKGSCTDRFAQALFKRFAVKPAEYLNQSIEVITSGFRAKKLDAAVIWEPTTSRLVQEGLARKVATGVSVDESDAGFLVMSQALIEQRPDVVKGWLQAELDAQLYFADGKNANDISKMALAQTTGFSQKELWFAAYGTYPSSQGGTGIRIQLPYGISPDTMALIRKASTFLLEIKSISQEIRPEAVVPGFAAEILKERNLQMPIGAVKAQPDTAYLGE